MVQTVVPSFNAVAFEEAMAATGFMVATAGGITTAISFTGTVIAGFTFAASIACPIIAGVGLLIGLVALGVLYYPGSSSEPSAAITAEEAKRLRNQRIQAWGDLRAEGGCIVLSAKTPSPLLK